MENTPIRGQRPAPLGRRLVASLLPGLPWARLPCSLALVIGLVMPLVVTAQSGAGGSISGRVQNAGNGKYLNNARITIEGTNREAFTNDFGEFRLNDVPAGDVKVRAFYTGLDSEVATVAVTGGQAAELNFNLSSKERYGEEKPLTLDTFKVTTNREFEGRAIATNEQRFAPNIKNVIAADAFGDVTEGNPGEFLKYLPGITVNYVAADVRTVNIRGFADTFTNVSIDGMRVTSASSGNSNRVFEFEQVSLNNVARVEVSKVPTPDTPADALGGNVNMISKNAFERKGTEFNYRAYLSFNNEDTKLFSKTPGPGNKNTYKVLPGFDFDLAIPFNKKFGIVITGLSSNQFNEQHRWQPTWNYAQAGATVANPYLQSFQLQDGPKNSFRDSLSAKADWKITDAQVLSLMVQENYYASFFGNRNLNFNIGTNSVPTPATGAPLTWGPDFVNSATGRASVTQSGSFRNKYGNTFATALTYHLNGRALDIDAGVHTAFSKSWYRDLANGQFSAFSTAMQGVSQVQVSKISFPYFNWVANSAAGAAIDYNKLDNYRITTTRSQPVDGKAWMTGAFVDAKHDFNGLSIPFAVKVGGATREESKDNRRYQTDYTYLGADGVANTADDNAAPFLDGPYSTQDPYWGQKPIQWGSPYLLADQFKAHPEYFRDGTGTAATGVQSETFRISNSQQITERVAAAYAQIEGKLFNNRLNFVAGVRYEKTSDKGKGPLIDPAAAFLRNANGSFVDGDLTTPGIQRVRKPEAGAAGSLASLHLTNIERAFHASRSYDGYYPSIHLTYNLSDNLLARLSYAKTIGRPDYSNIIPGATINENADPSLPGTIAANNPGLEPWTADNFDLSLEYYFKRGGIVSVGAFTKTLAKFWASTTTTLTADQADLYGLDASYAGWQVTTLQNAGEAKIEGLEVNFQRSLDFLPSVGRYFSVSTNATTLQLSGPNGKDLNGFISKTANFSLSWNKAPVSAQVTWNYRGRQRGQNGVTQGLQTGAQYGSTVAIATANNFNEYFASRYYIDVNLQYTLSKRLRFFLNARNVTNSPQTLERYNDSSPDYARGFRSEEFGIQIAAGIKGTF
jgi:TonB-dependent receptor